MAAISGSPLHEAKDCPFCGSDRVGRLETSDGKRKEDNQFWIYCRRCSAAGPVADTATMATERWNRRMKN